MKILIATDSFKGSLSSSEAAGAIADGIRSVLPSADVECIPVADGGEGSLDAVMTACGGTRRHAIVNSPLGDPTEAEYLVTDDGEAFIESAEAVGLCLVPKERRDPIAASSFGLGQLILDAVSRGCEDITVFLGGSAVNDGGAGMLKALGVRYLDKNGRPVEDGAYGLLRVDTVDVSRIPKNVGKCRFTVCADVRSPLLGKEGASAVFAPQKGATLRDVSLLEEALSSFASAVHKTVGTSFEMSPSSGAAGGIAFALMSFFGAQVVSGAEWVLDRLNFDGAIGESDVVVTGEGKLDLQSGMGKAVSVVAKRARAKRKPVIAFCGRISCEKDETARLGFDLAVETALPNETDEDAMKNAAERLRNKAAEVFSSRWCHEIV